MQLPEPTSEYHKQLPVLENRRNNIFSDREGNIYRNTLNGWERHRREGWSRPELGNQQQTIGRVTPENRQQTIERPSQENRPRTIEGPASRGRGIPEQRHEQMPEQRGISEQRHEQVSGGFERNREELNQELRARSRGDERTHEFQQYRSTSSSRGGGGDFRRGH